MQKIQKTIYLTNLFIALYGPVIFQSKKKNNYLDHLQKTTLFQLILRFQITKMVLLCQPLYKNIIISVTFQTLLMGDCSHNNIILIENNL